MNISIRKIGVIFLTAVMIATALTVMPVIGAVTYQETISDIPVINGGLGGTTHADTHRPVDGSYETILEQQTGGDITNYYTVTSDIPDHGTVTNDFNNIDEKPPAGPDGLTESILEAAGPGLPIAHDSSTGLGDPGENQWHEWQHTFAAGSNKLLVVSVASEEAIAEEPDTQITSLTYDGAPLTSAGYYRFDGGTYLMNCSTWYLLDTDFPAVPGAYEVNITFNGDCRGSTGHSTTLFNMAQEGPENTAGQGGEPLTSPYNTNIETFTDGVWLVDIVGAGGAYEPYVVTQGPEQVARWQGGGNSMSAAQSTKYVATATTPGTTPIGWSDTGNNRASHYVCAFKPALGTQSLEHVWTVDGAESIPAGADTLTLNVRAETSVGDDTFTFEYSDVSSTGPWTSTAITVSGAMADYSDAIIPVISGDIWIRVVDDDSGSLQTDLSIDRIYLEWFQTNPIQNDLEHQWQFTNVPAGGISVWFHAFVGYSGGGDTYNYYYSQTGAFSGEEVLMFTDNTPAVNQLSYNLGAGFSGAFYVMVIDSVTAEATQDTLNVDCMYVEHTTDDAPTVTVDNPGSTPLESYVEGVNINIQWTPLDDNAPPWNAATNYWVYLDDDNTGYDADETLLDSGDNDAGTSYLWDTTGYVGTWWIYIVVEDNVGQQANDYSTFSFDVVPDLTWDKDMTGIGPGQWVLTSFPIDASGPPETVVNDTSWGDGGTDWDTIYAWDAVNQEWISYSKFKPPALNTLTFLDNTMGFWVHITVNGGDQMLSFGGGGMPGVAVNVPLEAGWNLVGYPSGTPRQADLTLPPEVTRMAVYDPAQAYDFLDVTDLTTVTMSAGNAYWVYSTSSTTWTVNP